MADYILDKTELAKYVAYKYKTTTGESIGRIRLQKTLYFLYAYWIKQNSSITSNELLNQNSELDTDPVDNFKMLFQQSFEAWAYGPVDPEIYALQKVNTFQEDAANLKIYLDSFMTETDEFILDFIDTYLEAINQLNDFTLVDISHSDSAWKKNFDRNRSYNNTRITDADIISDYAK